MHQRHKECKRKVLSMLVVGPATSHEIAVALGDDTPPGWWRVASAIDALVAVGYVVAYIPADRDWPPEYRLADTVEARQTR